MIQSGMDDPRWDGSSRMGGMTQGGKDTPGWDGCFKVEWMIQGGMCALEYEG